MDTQPPSAPRAGLLKKTVLGLCLLVLLLVCLGLAVSSYFRYIGKQQLNEALAEVDRVDPGWQWGELEQSRAPVSEAENAAPWVEAVHKLLPPGWPDAAPANPETGLNQKSVLEELPTLEPVYQLTAPQRKDLQAELEKFKPAVTEARALAGLRLGRYPAMPLADFVSSKETPWGHPRQVANLLLLDAAWLADQGQIDEALLDGRATVVTGRSLGDTPHLICHLVRVACRRQAQLAVERALAQGQASEAALRATQELLADEEAQPLLLWGLRGERAYEHQVMQWMEEGNWDRLAAGGVPEMDNVQGRLGMRLMTGWFNQSHARMLELLTEAVAIARLPLEKQRPKFQELERKAKAMRDSRAAFGALAVPAVVKVAEATLRSRADLRCAGTALAAERYRLANGRWPAMLQELVPKLLAEVPLDPYDGQPLRYRRLADGVVIYALGPDGKDDGGRIGRKDYAAAGTDLGFRLWDAGQRRQPPPVEADDK